MIAWILMLWGRRRAEILSRTKNNDSGPAGKDNTNRAGRAALPRVRAHSQSAHRLIRIGPPHEIEAPENCCVQRRDSGR
jgi:hypothetical protein